MPKIPYQISPIPSLTIDIIHVLYNTLAPGVELDRVVDSTDHSSPQSVLFANLDAGTYIIKIHSSADGVALGNLLHDFWVDAVTDETILEILFYQVNGPEEHDPVVGINKIIDPYFAGKNILSLYREGARPLKKTVEWLVNGSNEIELLVGMVDGIPITNDIPDIVWVVTIAHSQTAGGVTTQIYADVMIITADATADSTHWNKDIFARAAGNKLTFTMPAIASIPENKGFVLVHDGGNAINVILALQVGETCRFMAGNKVRIPLGIGECIKAIKKTISGTSYLFVEAMKYDGDRVGLPTYGRQTMVNTVILDGTEYDPNVHVRLGDYVNQLPGSQIVPYGTAVGQFDYQDTVDGQTYFPNHGFFAVDNVNNKFKVPNYLNKSLRFLKNIGGSDVDRVPNIPGAYQRWAVGHHQHVGLSAENTSHASGSSAQSVPNVKLLVNTTGGIVTTVSGAITGVYDNGKETTTRNLGFLPLMYI